MNHLFRSLFGDQHHDEYVSGVFSDSLDKLGHDHQVSCRWLLNAPQARMFGRARTVTLETIATDDERIQKGLGFLGGLGPDDVMVVKGSHEYAYFGELMSRLSMERNINGVVIDGLTRDTYYTTTIDLPVFARGYSPVDIKGRGRVDEVDVPVEIDGITVTPGDYVFGDNDAVVFMPVAVMDALLAKVAEAIAAEANIKKMIASGNSIREILLDHKEF